MTILSQLRDDHTDIHIVCVHAHVPTSEETELRLLYFTLILTRMEAQGYCKYKCTSICFSSKGRASHCRLQRQHREGTSIREAEVVLISPSHSLHRRYIDVEAHFVRLVTPLLV
jgi:hypothetical protein